MKKFYEFNITIIGSGESVDEAFQSALDSLKEANSDAIVGDVVYTAIRGNPEHSDPDPELDN